LFSPVNNSIYTPALNDVIHQELFTFPDTLDRTPLFSASTKLVDAVLYINSMTPTGPTSCTIDVTGSAANNGVFALAYVDRASVLTYADETPVPATAPAFSNATTTFTFSTLLIANGDVVVYGVYNQTDTTVPLTQIANVTRYFEGGVLRREPARLRREQARGWRVDG
jgi:hypothetical protein